MTISTGLLRNSCILRRFTYITSNTQAIALIASRSGLQPIEIIRKRDQNSICHQVANDVLCIVNPLNHSEATWAKYPSDSLNLAIVRAGIYCREKTVPARMPT